MHRLVMVQGSWEYVERCMETWGWTNVFIFSSSLNHCPGNRKDFDGKKNITFFLHWEASSLEIKKKLKISTEVEKLYGFHIQSLSFKSLTFWI